MAGVIAAVALLALVFAVPAQAAPGDVTVTQVEDINPAPGADAEPEGLLNVNGTLYFAADDGVHGVELWKSDGTAAGTTMVGDINPGPSDSGPQSLTNVNGTVYFSASDGVTGRELWKSNGGPIGLGATQLVADIHPTLSSLPSNLRNVGGTLYFTADDGVNGVELWKSNGGPLAPGWTEMVANIRAGSASSSPIFLTPIGNTVYFRANDGISGLELWKSTGGPLGPGGTELVANINPAGADANVYGLTNFNGTLLFGANDGTTGLELWKSNGGPLGPGGTERVGDLNPFTDGAPSELTDVNGTVFFSANGGIDGFELWRTNGQTSGTSQVADINPAPGVSGSPNRLTQVGGTLFFQASDGVTGFELWKSNGGPLGAGGTEMIADIIPGSGSSTMGEYTAVNDALFFWADDGAFGRELWRSNGGPLGSGGTARVADVNPGGPDSSPESLTNVNGTLFFSADDGSTGIELWKATVEGPAAPVTPGTPAKPKKKKCKKSKKRKCKKKRKK